MLGGPSAAADAGHVSLAVIVEENEEVFFVGFLQNPLRRVSQKIRESDGPDMRDDWYSEIVERSSISTVLV